MRMFQPMCVSCAAQHPRRGGSLGFLNRLTRSLTADAISDDCILAPCTVGRNLGIMSMNCFGLHYLPIHAHESSGTTRCSAIPSLAVAYLRWGHPHGVSAPTRFRATSESCLLTFRLYSLDRMSHSSLKPSPHRAVDAFVSHLKN